jgi:hypothetical protein
LVDRKSDGLVDRKSKSAGLVDRKSKSAGLVDRKSDGLVDRKSDALDDWKSDGLVDGKSEDLICDGKFGAPFELQVFERQNVHWLPCTLVADFCSTKKVALVHENRT